MAGMSPETFDREALRAALTAALRAAWEELSASGESAYGLMLYEGAEYGYICVTGFTEEGLDRVTATYREGRMAEQYRGDEGREGLRWSAPDSPHHVLAEVTAPPLLSSDAVDDLSGDPDDCEPFDSYLREVREVCLLSLEDVDREGAFGQARDGLTLLLLSRDETESVDDLVAIARRLNPRPIADRYTARWG